MVVIILEKATERIRGELTKWFLELKPGVFVGNVNAKIRELLWDRVCSSPESNGAIMLFSCNNEQGFSVLLGGTQKRTIIDLDGIFLIKIQ